MAGPKKLRSWETKESRYYCAVCNAWMGNDRQSILLHENGKKHKENVAKSLQEKRDNRAAQDKQAAQMKGALKAMEQAAMASLHTGTDSLYYDTSNLTSAAAAAVPAYVPPPPPPQRQQSAPKANASKKKEQDEWKARKKQRQEKDKQQSEEQATPAPVKRTIAPDEGHYQHDSNTYLEATVFGDILEEDMPIQIWTGSNLASAQEKKLPHHHDLWTNGLVAAVRKRNPTGDNPDDKVVDVAYLKNPTDEEETLEQGVLLHRIRILLGGDESIPGTLQEARIMAMGGEEIQVQHGKATATVDASTGLTGWSTVTIKRTTVHQEAREERAKQRQKERQAKRAAQEEAKQAQVRKMEESRVQNAEDSALGAFDVWSQTQKGGYKGVDIHAEAQVTVEDTAKRLATKGETVAFKKTSKFKKAGKKRNRRTTSADDD